MRVIAVPRFKRVTWLDLSHLKPQHTREKSLTEVAKADPMFGVRSEAGAEARKE